jgi:signal transduction histidine kinase
MAKDLADARRTELEFVAFRWLAVLYGVVQTSLAVRDVAKVPSVVVPLAFVLTAGLAISNIAIWSAARRAQDRRQLAVIGAVAFILDVVVVLAMTWAFTTGPQDVVWLIAYVLPLEGAARYGRAGALAAALAFTGSAFLREHYLVAQFPPYGFSLKAVEFRCAMAFVIALTAGTFSRSLHLQTERANERASEAEASAAREAAARARLQELDDLKSDFIAITSHELRTPVAAVRGFVDTLRRRRGELTEDEVREFLDIIHDQSDRLVRLVEDLLDVSRLEAGRLTLEWQEVAVGDILSGCITGMGDTGSRIDPHEAPGCPDTIVVDPQRLGQVLTNLVGNALKFSPPGARVELGVEPSGDAELVFSVRDRGPGIPESEHEKIFQRFEQADSAATRNTHGVGLGLYITRELANAMGGSVTLSSEVGAGSTFRVTIPVVAPVARPAPVQQSVATRSG